MARGGCAVLVSGPNRGLRFQQSQEGGEGVSHVAPWWESIPSMRKSWERGPNTGWGCGELAGEEKLGGL